MGNQKRLAIISVYNKDGLAPFAKKLSQLGIDILSTGGTAKFLTEQGIPITKIDAYTGHPEILDGRVKSLHPKIHGGILARRDLAADNKDLEQQGISPIDFVIVNLYPFIDKIDEAKAKKNPNAESLVEFIDIGGPTMIRAAAKNWRFVVPVCDPSDYPIILSELEATGAVSESTRKKLAAKVYQTMAAYDAQVARYFSLEEEIVDSENAPFVLAPVEGLALKKVCDLRYGENPHQKAALYDEFSAGSETQKQHWAQLQGKEISYNNLQDMQGALELFIELYADLAGRHAAVVIKHANPSGVAIRKTNLEAFQAARACDPVSSFGGIIAVSGVLDKALSECILEQFVEVVLFNEIDDKAREVFSKKKNVRLLQCDFDALLKEQKAGGVSYRKFYNQYLVQTLDTEIVSLKESQAVTQIKPSAEQLRDLDFAWKVCKYVKSNAIVIVKNEQAIGVGAGQMSRLDSAQIAVKRAATHGHSVEGAVVASDAFLPFSDVLEILNDAGVVSLAQPGGSINDQPVIDAANARGMSMLFTGMRHFRH